MIHPSDELGEDFHLPKTKFYVTINMSAKTIDQTQKRV